MAALVVPGKDRRKRTPAVEQAGHCEGTAVFIEVTLEHKFRISRNAEFFMCAEKAHVAVDRVGMVVRPGDMGDTPVPQAEQVASSEVAAMDVIKAHGIQVVALQAPSGGHHRLAAGKLDKLCVGQAAVKNDQAIDTPLP